MNELNSSEEISAGFYSDNSNISDDDQSDIN